MSTPTPMLVAVGGGCTVEIGEDPSTAVFMHRGANIHMNMAQLHWGPHHDLLSTGQPRGSDERATTQWEFVSVYPVLPNSPDPDFITVVRVTNDDDARAGPPLYEMLLVRWVFFQKKDLRAACAAILPSTARNACAILDDRSYREGISVQGLPASARFPCDVRFWNTGEGDVVSMRRITMPTITTLESVYRRETHGVSQSEDLAQPEVIREGAGFAEIANVACLRGITYISGRKDAKAPLTGKVYHHETQKWFPAPFVRPAPVALGFGAGFVLEDETHERVIVSQYSLRSDAPVFALSGAAAEEEEPEMPVVMTVAGSSSVGDPFL